MQPFNPVPVPPIPEPTPEQRAAYGTWVREGLGADLVTVT